MNFNLAAEPKTLDPQIASDSSAVIAIQAMFEGLARIGSDQKAYPGVAEKWTSNANNTEFTFTLRSDAKWADEKETPVTANDFVYAFRRALSPSTGSKTCSALFCIKNAKEVNSGTVTADKLGVTAKDDHTLVVELNYSYPDFPELTASAVFMPCNQKFFEITSGRYGLERKYLLGNGPFEIDGKYGWEHGKYLNLVRSASYSGNSKPLPSNIRFTIEDSDTAITNPIGALSAGTVDAIAIEPDEVSAASAVGATLTSFEDTTWGLCFNTHSDFMKSRNIRKAFLQSLDRSKVTQYLPKNVDKAENILCPSTTFMGDNFRSLVGGGSYYLKQDKNTGALLSAGLNELSLSELKSVSVICPDDPNVKLMVNEMITTWNSKFNNYFNIEPLDRATLDSRVKSGSYQIALYAIQPVSDGPLSALSLFKSGAVGNAPRMDDPNFDAMLNDAQNKSGSAATAAYAAAEKYLNEQAVFYPLYYEKHYFASAKGVNGIVFHPYGMGIDFIQAGKE